MIIQTNFIVHIASHAFSLCRAQSFYTISRFKEKEVQSTTVLSRIDVELHLATYTNLLPYVEDVEFHINSFTTVLSQFPAWTI
jgi:uncharacterized protein (DUF1499 family)